MIYGNIHYKSHITQLPNDLRDCLEYAKTHNLSELEPGIHPIRGKEVYINLVAYETAPREERAWEAHRAYIDIHLILSGSELADISFIEDLETTPYSAEKDILSGTGSARASVLLEAGDFLVCYPEDAHRAGIMTDKPAPTKKATFKIMLAPFLG